MQPEVTQQGAVTAVQTPGCQLGVLSALLNCTIFSLFFFYIRYLL